MRLLNARTFQLVEFVGNPPPYAILSHTWSTQEVSFQAILSGGAYYMRGFWKIHGCCEKALEDNLEYVWVDTCCIDKSSPAELSEAINSMFEWYKNAHVCYVYLEDVDVEFPYSRNEGPNYWTYTPDGSPSRWYTRGWTLQELLAPSNVVFYNTRWDRIGTKRQLLREISDITKIDEMNLIEFGIRPTSVGQKMSWAANRTTTRPEDMAYCLLGLFGVHLPLLYGEGRNAFRRLQEEIIKCSTDMSIFIWKDGDTPLVTQGNWGVLATSPGCFVDFPFVPNFSRKVREYRQLPYVVTNAGLRITLPLIPLFPSGIRQPLLCKLLNRKTCDFKTSDHPETEQLVVAVLDCVTIYGREENPVVAGVLLQQMHSGERFRRVACSHFLYIDVNDIPQPKEAEILISCDYPPPALHRSLMTSDSVNLVRFMIRPWSSVRYFLRFKPNPSRWEHVDVEDTLLIGSEAFIALELLFEGARCIITFKLSPDELWHCSITPDPTSENAIEEALGKIGPDRTSLERGPDGVWVNARMRNNALVVVSLFEVPNYSLGLHKSSPPWVSSYLFIHVNCSKHPGMK
ncbi:hypothetical protein ETB97_009592 [Aspergillus alliaceus]|uniref:Heterokaryon incompatibility domain-containing protein n=1 Tax=Petromyces alliaceus TaxID=209559 RepID=A0A8H6ABF6_PETAA|nr:hypothetical protein ETB97_009592 [Aspergillus burnettii]